MNNTPSIEDLIKQSRSSTQPQSSGLAQDDPLGEKIKEIDIKEQERVTKRRAADLNLGFISLRGYPISPEMLKMVPEMTARKTRAIPFYESNGQVRLGIVDPTTPGLEELVAELMKRYRQGVDLYLISEDSFEHALKNYDRIVKIKRSTDTLDISTEEVARYQTQIRDFKALDAMLKEASVTEVFIIILSAAIKSSASDVHIEAGENKIKVRFRLDGVLFDVATLPQDQWPKIVSRVKLIAKLKLNITTVPQDGRITVAMPEDKIDIRVSTLPTAYGESVVMRLLRSSGAGMAFDDLGLRGAAYERLKSEIKRTNGMIITTGPTGSGKTTTLYAILNQINSPEAKIITLEDPIEYKLDGVSQSQIDASKDYTFAKGLRAILRQDPDIVMVGEIRDSETTEIAIQAALTGHLVLSTIHTNSASGAIPRFIALNAKPFLLAPALNAVMAQRLVRRLCDNCAQPETLAPETLEKVKQIVGGIPASSGYQVSPEQLQFKKGTGCEQCSGLGLKGRIGIYEVFIMDDEIKLLVQDGKVSETEIQKVAVAQGMITLLQDGILKALDGITTVDEVFRVAA
ncbi:MAG: GspE/PulE family protein [bacterium]|nr:GspE/PulE family protein [bacterium]